MSAVTKYVPSGASTVEAGVGRARRRAGPAGAACRRANSAKYASGRPSATATAGCSGPALTKVRNCLTRSTAETSGAGPLTQPTFQPVQEKVLPAEEIRSVRSRIPGSVASGTCGAAASGKTRCSYTSSVTAYASCSRQSSATSASSSRVNTLPVGLCGEFSSTSRVRGPNAARSSAGSKAYRPSAPGRSVTGRRTAPASAIAGGVRVVVRLEADHLVARLAEREDAGGDRLGGARGHHDLAVRVVLQAPEPALVGGDGRAQRRDARARRVLVVAGAQRLGGRGQHLRRAVGVGEALAEVDRAGTHGERGHLGEDGGPERPHPGHQRVDIGECRHLRQPTARAGHLKSAVSRRN